MDHALEYKVHAREKYDSMVRSFNICKKLAPLLSKEEIDDKDIDVLKANFRQLTLEAQEEYIDKVRSITLKEIAKELHAGNDPKIEKLTQKQKNEKLQKACYEGDQRKVKLLLEVKADYTKLDYSKMSPEMIKFLRSYGVKIKSATLPEQDILKMISGLEEKALKEIFNNIDPNKYKDAINKALDDSNHTVEDKNKFMMFLCKKGFNPKNFTDQKNMQLGQDITDAMQAIVDPKNIRTMIKIMGEEIGKTAGSNKVDSEKIYKKMQDAKLIPKDINEEKKTSVINKINKIMSEYNHQNRSNNLIKRAIRSLLHFVGVKYVGEKEAVAVLSKVNLPSSKSDKSGLIGR